MRLATYVSRSSIRADSGCGMPLGLPTARGGPALGRRARLLRYRRIPGGPAALEVGELAGRRGMGPQPCRCPRAVHCQPLESAGQAVFGVRYGARRGAHPAAQLSQPVPVHRLVQDTRSRYPPRAALSARRAFDSASVASRSWMPSAARPRSLPSAAQRPPSGLWAVARLVRHVSRPGCPRLQGAGRA